MYYLNYFEETISVSSCLREESAEYKVNRQYKDSLFRFIFGREENKQNLLDLYNALNNSYYENKDDLEINTLENAIYMRMKNDVSFVIDSQMVLLEHQSTFNPNMPLRGFLYFAKLYETRIATKTKLKNIYYPKLIKIPAPRYIVLYNGYDKNIGESMELRLSDAFEDSDKNCGYEWTARMININIGKNRELLLKCKKLQEYSYFVDSVRKLSKKFDLSTAVDKAVDICIGEGVLSDILHKYRAEVKNMLLTEFDEEKDWAIIAEGFREIGFDDGKKEGIKEGKKEGIKEGIKEGQLILLANLVDENIITIEQASEKLKMTVPDFHSAVNKLSIK